ncbi:hypothetical protein [Flavobacterium sp.]|uniref:hypothetical protein n=1 Tax=Flavobacterium sp. TaxID=239 RepID=UPI0037514A55
MYSQNNNDILIYDKTQHFIKLVKHYCGNCKDIVFCDEKEKVWELNFETIRTAYAIIEEKFDLPELVKISNNVEDLYIATNSIVMKNYLKKLENVKLFNKDKDKFKIMNEIFNKTVGFDIK